MEKFNYTTATESQVTNALGTTIAVCNIVDLREQVKELLFTPELMKSCSSQEIAVGLEPEDKEKYGWRWELTKSKNDNLESYLDNCEKVKQAILEVLTDEVAEYLNRKQVDGTGEGTLEEFYQKVYDNYKDMPEEKKDLVRFGYLLAGSLSAFHIGGFGVISDGCNDNGVSCFASGMIEIIKTRNIQLQPQ